MKVPSLSEMLEAGVYFGHKKERSHPRAKSFIYTLRNGVYVINLEMTQELLAEALKFLEKTASEGKTILFVGTKPQAKELIKKTAEELQMPYVTFRWLGGTLTNFETIKKNIDSLKKLEEEVSSEEFKKLTKKEKALKQEKLDKMHKVLDGISSLKKLPDALFIIDTNHERIAVSEARKKEIPTVGICDTNSNPDIIDYPIPSNDDAVSAIEMILKLVADAIKSGLVKKKPEKGDKNGKKK